MDTLSERIRYLLRQYLDDRITEGELKELLSLLDDNASSGAARRVLGELAGEGMRDAGAGGDAVPGGNAGAGGVDKTGAVYKEEEWDPLFEAIMARGGDRARSRSRPLAVAMRRWWVAAAVFLFVVAGGGWWWRQRAAHGGVTTPAVVAQVHDAAPGSSKAILTLADGRTLRLDSASGGVVGRQGGEELLNKDERLIYEAAGDAGAADTAVANGYNVLVTPRGGQYQVVLPDGTRAWLNADTYLRYPTRFTGKDRTVELRGEAYFEVAGNAHAPFRVRVLRGEKDPMLVDVLGTHFDIMSYADEPAIRTTLLEGAVRVVHTPAAVVLKPGQQARLDNNDHLAVVAADLDEAVAWKNGLFKFNGAGIGQVMRQLSRWYDLDVEYVHGVPTDLFQGELYRDVRVSELLKILEGSGVHFTVEGRRLLVK